MQNFFGLFTPNIEIMKEKKDYKGLVRILNRKNTDEKMLVQVIHALRNARKDIHVTEPLIDSLINIYKKSRGEANWQARFALAEFGRLDLVLDGFINFFLSKQFSDMRRSGGYDATFNVERVASLFGSIDDERAKKALVDSLEDDHHYMYEAHISSGIESAIIGSGPRMIPYLLESKTYHAESLIKRIKEKYHIDS